MRRRPRVLRGAAAVLVLIGLAGGAFAAGRSTVTRKGPTDPLRLDHGIAVSVLDTPTGALAAADNYVATGITASLDNSHLRRFANAVVGSAARARFIAATQSLAENSALPAGTHALCSVVAHRLDSYGGGSAGVTVWTLSSEWDGGLAPTQDSALIELSLLWSGGRWRVAAVQESLPGPVPELVAGPREAKSTGVWDAVLSRMSAPYYGDN